MSKGRKVAGAFYKLVGNTKKKKRRIRKLLMDNHEDTTEPKRIMTEIHDFYSKLINKRIKWKIETEQER